MRLNYHSMQGWVGASVAAGDGAHQERRRGTHARARRVVARLRGVLRAGNALRVVAVGLAAILGVACVVPIVYHTAVKGLWRARARKKVHGCECARVHV